MKAPKPLDLPTVLRFFEAIPELASAGAFAGANALYFEHLENPLGRFSLAALREFLERLMEANQAVAQATLKPKPTQ